MMQTVCHAACGMSCCKLYVMLKAVSDIARDM